MKKALMLLLFTLGIGLTTQAQLPKSHPLWSEFSPETTPIHPDWTKVQTDLSHIKVTYKKRPLFGIEEKNIARLDYNKKGVFYEVNFYGDTGTSRTFTFGTDHTNQYNFVEGTSTRSGYRNAYLNYHYHDNKGKLTRIEKKRQDKQETWLELHQYTYNAQQRLHQRVVYKWEAGKKVLAERSTYFYDVQGRLKQEKLHYKYPETQYDHNLRANFDLRYLRNARGQLTKVTVDEQFEGDQEVYRTEVLFTYQKNGQVLKKAYDPKGNDGTRMEWHYNARGNIIRRERYAQDRLLETYFFKYHYWKR